MDRTKKVTSDQEPYYPDGGYGWVIVFAIIIINSLSVNPFQVCLLTLVPCFGLIFGDEFRKWGVTSAQTSLLLHLHNSLYCTFGFFTSPLLKYYGMRRVAFIGAAMMCLGLFFSSYATSYAYLIFSTSFLIGVGQGTVMPATYLAVYCYFKKRLTIAVSLTVTSATLSTIIIPKICEKMYYRAGRKYTVLLLFVVSLFSFVGCFLLKPVKQQTKTVKCVESPEIIEKQEETEGELLQKNEPIDEVYVSTTVPKENNSSIWLKIFDVFDLHLLQNIPFVIITAGLGISFAAELNIVLMIQFMLEDLSLFNKSEIATAIAVQGGTDIIGRLCIPLVAHYFNFSAKLMYIAALIVASLSRTVLALWPLKKLVVFFVIAFIGLTKGSRAVFQSVILPKYVPLEKIAAANGINMCFTGFISLIVGPLIGVIKDTMGSTVYALHAASFLSMLCVIMWAVEYIFWENNKTDDNANEPEHESSKKMDIDDNDIDASDN
ncbi:hypothetical protein ABEB36_003868 [Hypothenemus hampei]|uniref:Uncharacterized protein n=1 Tax=Hypothenemus hampei TaxID=57062 RepID=A0ABD1F1E1_HYPHA